MTQKDEDSLRNSTNDFEEFYYYDRDSVSS